MTSNISTYLLSLCVSFDVLREIPLLKTITKEFQRLLLVHILFEMLAMVPQVIAEIIIGTSSNYSQALGPQVLIKNIAIKIKITAFAV